jgi:hypothetical protein
MGGKGSGRKATHEYCVEDCWVLNLQQLSERGFFGESFFQSIPIAPPILRPELGGGTVKGRYGWVGGRIVYILQYRRRKSVELRIRRVPDYDQGTGYKSLWHCPLGGKRGCNKRVQKLYLPPTALYYGCRSCHQLTYSSQRKSGRKLGRGPKRPPQFDRLVHQRIQLLLKRARVRAQWERIK